MKLGSNILGTTTLKALVTIYTSYEKCDLTYKFKLPNALFFIRSFNFIPEYK